MRRHDSRIFVWIALALVVFPLPCGAVPANRATAPAESGTSAPATVGGAERSSTPPAPDDPSSLALALPDAFAPMDQAILFLQETLRYSQRLINSIRGEYTEVRSSPLFTDDVWTTGQFIFVREPFQYRCEAVTRRKGPGAAPVKSITWITSGTTYVYLPESQQVSIYSPESYENPLRQLNYVLLSFLARKDDLLDLFDVKVVFWSDQNHNQLRLSPYFPLEMGGVTLLLVDIEHGTRYPSRVFVKEDNGDETRIAIRIMQVNVAIDEKTEKDLRPRYPSAVEVVRLR